MDNITTIFDTINTSLFLTTGTLDYSDITDSIIELAQAIESFEGDSTELWHIGECGLCCLDDLIIGAYWHFTEWHGGQSSRGYLALCALGAIFDPNMSTPDETNETYTHLATMAAE